MKGVGHAPREHPWVPRSMSLNAPYLKEREYIRFMGGDLNGFQDIMHFMKWRGWGMPPGDPLGSQDPCHLMCLIIRNKNIYGLGRVFWTISKLLCIFTFSHTDAYATKFDLGLKFMMGPHPRCYILSSMQIGPAVPEEKIFEGFLPYMGMAAILVMWPKPHMQTFVPPSHGASTWNLTSIGPVVPEEKTFENVNTRHTDRQTDNSLAIW